MVTPVTHEKMDDRCCRVESLQTHSFHLVNKHTQTVTHAPFTDASRKMKLCHPKPRQTLCHSLRGRLHALSVTHLSTHLLTFFRSDIFPLNKVIILAVRRVKGDHVPPVTVKRLPTAMLSRNMCTDAAECSHADEGGAGGEEQTSLSADDLRCSDAPPITDICRHPTPFSQNHSLRLYKKPTRYAENGKALTCIEFCLPILNLNTVS